MTADQIRKLLDDHKTGVLSSDDALARLKILPYEDLGFANIDHHRSLRQGFPEVISGTSCRTRAYCSAEARVTRMLCWFAAIDATIRGKGLVMVVSAGTSDIPVAEEALVTLSVMGNHVE